LKKAGKLRFDFNAAARRARRDHPVLENTLFIHAGRDDWRDTAAVLANLSVDEEEITALGRTVKEARRVKTSFHQAMEGKKPAGAIVFHPDRHPLYGARRGAVDDAGTFDHETGHALFPGMEGARSENVADAFAALRHLQRFGGETEDLDYCAWKRAMIFMRSGATSHLTTFTVDKIVLDSRSADFMSLSPQETAAIARAYAKRHTLSEKRLKKLAADFRPLKKLPPKQAFRKLARLTLAAPPDTPTFYLGARILSGALRPEGTVLDGRKIILNGREWDRLRDQLDARLQQLPRRHPLRRAGPL
jgi:hypothetical protein